MNFNRILEIGIVNGEEEMEEIGEYFNQKGEDAVKVILAKMKEETFVRAVRKAQAMVMTNMMVRGMGIGLALAEEMDELDAYTHTVILNVIGMLIEEEVF